jgi:hypothetical protein
MVVFELDSNGIRGHGARYLAEGVKGSDSITALHLGDNDINIAGVQVCKGFSTAACLLFWFCAACACV